jgi:hypothetical protein
MKCSKWKKLTTSRRAANGRTGFAVKECPAPDLVADQIRAVVGEIRARLQPAFHFHW